MDTDNTGYTEGHNIDNGIRDVLDTTAAPISG